MDSLYRSIEKSFFYTLTRKLLGNVAAIGLVVLLGYVAIYSWVTGKLTPEQLGDLAVFLCSAGADNVRGVAWNMDGGWAAQ